MRLWAYILFVMVMSGIASPNPAAADTNKTAGAVGFLYGDIYLRHDTGVGHPERPARLTGIVEHLKQTGLLAELTLLQPAPTSLEWITAVYAPEYVARVEKSCRERLGYVDTTDAPACQIGRAHV